VIDGKVALFPRTFRWRLDFNSPPSTTSHLTVSADLAFTASDIIPPVAHKQEMNDQLMKHNIVYCVLIANKRINLWNKTTKESDNIIIGF